MTAFTLKMIALTTMLIDHFAHVFGGRLVFALVPAMRTVGRLAFPIFVYFIGEGFRRTANAKKYLTRLGIFALISEIPFDLAINGVWLEFGHQNIFFTLFLGLLAAHIYSTCINNYGRLFILLPLPFAAAVVLQADYGLIGVVLVFTCSIIESRTARLLALAIGGLALYYPMGEIFNAMMLIGYTCALVLLSRYNEEQGPRMKWLFYSFYPLHLLALAGLLVLYESLA